MISRTLLLLSLAAGMLGSAACAARSDPMAAALAERNVNYEVPMNTAVFLDDGLQKVVTVERTSAGRNAANGLTVVAMLRNRSDGQMKLSARTQFFGSSKQIIESTAWTHLFLDRRGLGSYETSATNPSAAYYHIEIAYGR